MKFFKSKKFKWALIGIVIAVFVGVVIAAVKTTNQEYSGQPYSQLSDENRVDLNDEQKKRIDEVEPIIKETLKSEIGIVPIEYNYKFNGDSAKIDTVGVIFSQEDEDNNDFFNAKFYFDLNSNRPAEKDASLVLNLSSYESAKDDFYKKHFLSIRRTVRFQISYMRMQIYEGLLDSNELDIEGIDSLRGTSITTHDFYHPLSNKKEKIFLKRYNDLYKLKGTDLAKELLRLNLIPSDVQEKLNKQTETKK